MSWTDNMRSNRYSGNFAKNGNYRGGMWRNVTINGKSTNNTSVDTKIRKLIMQEIDKGIKNGENIDIIVKRIAEKESIKKQFDYYTKNGITDLAGIFKGWYESYKKNLPGTFTR